LLTLSANVVAIALTLLVLQLNVPSIAHSSSPADLTARLAEFTPAALA